MAPERTRAARPEGGSEVGSEGDRTGRLWVLRRLREELQQDQVPLLSAGVAFYALLALVPAILATVTVYALLADPATIQSQVSSWTEAAPQQVRDFLTSQIERLSESSRGSLGFGLVVALLVAVWSASSGVKHLIAAVNTAYNEGETRGFFRIRGLALLFTVGAVGLFLVALGIIAALPTAVRALDLNGVAGGVIRWTSFAVLGGLFVWTLTLLYRYAPDRSAVPWKATIPGAVVATVLWLGASIGFSFYAARFGDFNETYGSIGGIIVIMLWLVISAFSVILGAEINHVLEDRPGEPTGTTAGEQREREEQRAAA